MHFTQDFWIDLIGWAGGFLVLLAFALISLGKVSNQSPLYHWINIFGAIFLIINTGYLRAYPSMAVNVVWVTVATYALLKIFRKTTAKS